MRITEEQSKLLDTFICERLSSNIANKELLLSIDNSKGEYIVNRLKEAGWREDVEGKMAYYLVKSSADEVLMFFSLQCGSLFDSAFDEGTALEELQRAPILLQAIKNAYGVGNEKEKALEIIRAYQSNPNLSLMDYIYLVRNKRAGLKMLPREKEKEDNERINRVLSTYPGVELVLFCTNDNARATWHSYGFQKTMGEVLFWKFVAPLFFDIQQIVGCEYAFLFAADLSEDGILTNYYDVSLKFQKRFDIATNKPIYDFGCEFMCQKINDMKNNRENFFENFNIDEGEDII